MATNKQTQRIDKLETDLTQLRQRQQALEFYVEELKRKSRGITSATSRVAAVERNHTALSGEIEALTHRLNEQRHVTSPDNSVLKDIRKDFLRIEAAQNTHYQDLDGRLTALSGRLDDYGHRLEGLEGSDVHRFDFPATRLELTHDATIDVDTPWVEALIVGVFAGILSAAATNSWIAEDWKWQKDFWCALIVGVAAFWLMASFEKFSLKLNLSGKLIWAQRNNDKEEQPKKTVITSVVESDSPKNEKVSAGQY